MSDPALSFRPLVDRERIHRFFTELGRAFRRPARIFIVGGATLVYERLSRATLDSDLTAVRTLLAAEMISPQDLQDAWGEIAPRLPERGLSSAEIAEFEENLRLVLG